MRFLFVPKSGRRKSFNLFRKCFKVDLEFIKLRSIDSAKSSTVAVTSSTGSSSSNSSVLELLIFGELQWKTRYLDSQFVKQIETNKAVGGISVKIKYLEFVADYLLAHLYLDWGSCAVSWYRRT